MKVARLLLLGFAFWSTAPTGTAAEVAIGDRAKVSARFEPSEARPGQTVTWVMRMVIGDDYHSYPTSQADLGAADYITSFTKPKFGELVPVEDVAGPTDLVPHQDGSVTVMWVKGTAEWRWKFVVHPQATPGAKTIKFRGNLPVCNDLNCLNGVPPETTLTIAGAPDQIDPKYSVEVLKFPLDDPKARGGPDVKAPAGLAPPAPMVTQPAEGKGGDIAPPAASLEEHEANLIAVREQLEKFTTPTAGGGTGLWSFLVSAAFWGFVALLTPCVFPMIPITVSFFLHQSEKEHHRPIRMALIYCGTIILVLGVSALTLLTFFRALSVNPYMNIALGALFIGLALSLFGLYEITLPSKLTQFTSAREGKGGVIGTVFMALTFTIVSFTCVAPFLGGFGGMSDSKKFNWFELSLGAFVFSTTFAAPFFFLALFPSLIKKLPQSGSWLNSVKVVMGFLELAAALKFLRTAELRLLDTPQYFTYDLVLGVWIALALIVGLYLLNLFRLHHDEAIEHVGVVRMLIGVAFLSLALYLLPALFKAGKTENQRPRGAVYAWIDAFLLPEATEEDLPFSVNLKGTIDLARKDLERTGKRQYVFIDFTGVTCTNCKYNERTVFSRPDVREHMNQYRLVQMYTDTVPAKFYPTEVEDERRIDEAKKLNLPFQNQVFGTEQLPLYVALEVTKDKVVVRGVYDEGKINEPAAFVKFLKESKKEEKK
jgi:thiol:disulfide interchange protein DsbD